MPELDFTHPLAMNFVDLWADGRNCEALDTLNQIFSLLGQEPDSESKKSSLLTFQLYKVKLFGQMGRTEEARAILVSNTDHNCAISLKMSADIALGDLKDYELALHLATLAERKLNEKPDYFLEEDLYDEHLQQIYWIQAKSLDLQGAPTNAYWHFWEGISSCPEILDLNYTLELLEKWHTEGRFLSEVRATARKLLGSTPKKSKDRLILEQICN